MKNASPGKSDRPPGPVVEARQDAVSRPRIRLLALSATTFFIVSGGPYGLEEIILGHGYLAALALLVVVPILWSVPVAAMVGELASAMPDEGGYYAWVRRALGPFWGVQEAWLSLATSLFDMAIYPTLFVTYLGSFWPALTDTAFGRPGWRVGAAMIAACVVLNLRGARAVGRESTTLSVLLLAPFGAMIVIAIARLPFGGFEAARAALTTSTGSHDRSALVAGVLICMWNYCGWDNASTIATEVDDPQRTFPRAMLGTLLLVVGCYVGSVLAASVTGMPQEKWETGAWVEVARSLGGVRFGGLLATMTVLGGAISAIGMFNALLCSMSRLPLALAEDRWLPAFVARRSEKTGAPYVAIVLAAVAYTATLTLGLRRLVEIDVALYGSGLFLELVAWVVLRVREPAMPRPFRVPGGTITAALLSIPPMVILIVALWYGRAEEGALGLTAIELALAVAMAGPLLYLARRKKALADAG